MQIKVKTKWQDHVEGPAHQGLTRRDFIKRGLATGAMSVALPKLFGVDFIKAAQAGVLTCPAPVKNPGAIAQVYSSGGATMGARFISDAQAEFMNSTMAGFYGITGTNPVKLGPGITIDSTSPFGATLLQGPPGFPGGSKAWKTQVLGNICAGGHLGPFTADDAVGASAGLMGSVSLDKTSQIGKDFYINPTIPRAMWTNGTPAMYTGYFGNTSSLTTNTVTAPFNMIPAAAGQTTANEMNIAADGAVSIAQALASFQTSTRKGGAGFIQSAGCSFYGNAALTDPTFGSTLFNAANITDLSKAMTVSMLSPGEQAITAAFYQSAAGVVGGVMMQLAGRDYHGADPQSVITPADIEDGRAIVMFLAACYAAGQPGALIYLSNGQCIANGTVPVTATIDGVNYGGSSTNPVMNAPVGIGDAGGTYNAGLVIFYNPNPSLLPTPRYSGTVNSLTGAATVDLNVSSPANAVGGLFLTAQKYISGGTVPNSLVKRLQSMSIAPIPADLILI